VEIFAPPFISTFCSTSNGNILPFFACREKTKNPDFAWKSGFYCLLLLFKVVPPGIEPGTQGFSVQTIENHNSYTVCILRFISNLSTYFG
jgi:hypothetical protein